MSIDQEVLGLDLTNLTDEQVMWLHKIKNDAWKMQLLQAARAEGYQS